MSASARERRPVCRFRDTLRPGSHPDGSGLAQWCQHVVITQGQRADEAESGFTDLSDYYSKSANVNLRAFEVIQYVCFAFILKV